MPLWIVIFIIFGLYLVDRHNAWRTFWWWFWTVVQAVLGLGIAFGVLLGIALLYAYYSHDMTITFIASMVGFELIVAGAILGYLVYGRSSRTTGVQTHRQIQRVLKWNRWRYKP